MMYARYRPTVQIAVIAKYAHGTPALVPQSAGIVMISAATETAITALNGTRRWLMRRNIHHPGIPRSREKAYQVRDALVRPAAPQNSWPTVAMRMTAFAAHELNASTMSGIEPPPPLVTASTWLTAKSSASRTAQPASAEKNTDRHTPWA